ncbi:MAG TPA: hypothetical protein VFG62_21690 [Rhodopila sp.]|nr:hypothetical protein [Rhodopila sp.]
MPTRRGVLAAFGAAAAFGPGAQGQEARHSSAYRTATDLVQALADRQVSSRELVDAAIARIGNASV